jgi:hypothetical protein
LITKRVYEQDNQAFCVDIPEILIEILVR